MMAEQEAIKSVQMMGHFMACYMKYVCVCMREKLLGINQAFKETPKGK